LALFKLVAIDKQNHVEYKETFLFDIVLWLYRALIAKEDNAENLLVYSLGEGNAVPLHFYICIKKHRTRKVPEFRVRKLLWKGGGE
jgi:hypothetical protein